MAFDQAQSPRLGQRTSVESTYVSMYSGDELPEAAWHGQLIYRYETQSLQIYDDAAAGGSGGWLNVAGGVAGTLTFVGPAPPVSQNIGDIWFDSSDSNHMYRAASVGASTVGPGLWEDMQGSPPVPGAKTFYQDTPPTVASEGDLWFQTDNGNHEYYYHDAIWVTVQDTAITDAQDTADAAQSTADQAQSDASTALTTANDAQTTANQAQSDVAVVAPDGNPPASSPQPTVTGGIKSFFLRWDAIPNHDPVTYDIYVSTDPNFTPDPTTLYGSTAGTSMTVGHLATPDATTGSDQFVYNTSYYFRIVARDVDNPAPAGAPGTDQLVQINTPDVAAGYVYAGQLSADQITAGTLTADVEVASKLQTASSGQRVEMSSQGLVLYGPDGTSSLVSLPTDPSLPAMFKGQAELSQAIIDDRLTINGTTNQIGPNSSLSLQGQLKDPTALPTVQIGYDAPLSPAWANTGLILSGLTWDSRHSVWWTTQWFLGCALRYVDPVTGNVGSFACPERSGYNTFHPQSGLVWVSSQSVAGLPTTGGSFYLFGTILNNNTGVETWEIRRYDVVEDGSGNITGLTLGAYLNKGALSTYTGRACVALDPSDTTTVGYAYYNPNSVLRYAHINPLTLADIDNVAMAGGAASPISSNHRIAWFQRGIFDLGATRAYYMNLSGSTIYGFDPVNRLTNIDFPTANSVAMVGGVYGGPDGRFYTIDAAGYIYGYSVIMWTTQSSKWWAGYTLNDTTAPNPHTTGLSTKASFTMTKHANLTLTGPVLNMYPGVDDPNAETFYLGRGTAEPVATAMYQNGMATTPQNSVTLTNASFAGATPGTNNFTASGSAKILDTSGQTLMDSSGYGIWAPPGTIVMYGGATAPNGWLLCNGQAVSRQTYAALYNAFGQTSSPYGQGDGSTTFNLPDLQLRFPLGAGSTTPLGTAETSGGGDTLAGRQSRLNHQHTHGPGNYNAGQTWTNDPGATVNTPNTGTTNVGNLPRLNQHIHTVVGQSDSAGVTSSGGSNAQNHPLLALNFIVKY